jgi:excisionase family DNA binding protein
MTDRSWLNTDQTAAYLQVSKETLQRWRVRGEGPRYAKLPGLVRYYRDELDAWLKSRERESTSDSAA